MPLFSGRTILGIVVVVALILGGFVLRDVEYPWVEGGCEANPSYRRSLIEASTQRMRRINDLQTTVAKAAVAGAGREAQARLADIATEAEALAVDLASVDVVDYKREERDRAALAARGIATAARSVSGRLAQLAPGTFTETAAPLDTAAETYNDAMTTLVDTSRGCAG